MRWNDLPLPNAERVQRAYELALQAKPLAWLGDEMVLEHVNRHLTMLGSSIPATKVYSLWDSPWASVWDSRWDSLRDSLRTSVWGPVRDSLWDSLWASARDSVWDSVEYALVREDDDNPWLPLAELATHGVYLYGVDDDGTAYVSRGQQT